MAVLIKVPFAPVLQSKHKGFIEEKVSIAFACLVHQRAVTPGKVLEIRCYRANPYFYPQRESVQAADPAKRLQAGAGRALEGAEPPKWPRWVQASTNQGALKTPLCGNELCHLASQPANFFLLFSVLQAFIVILFGGLIITQQGFMNPASFPPKP